MRARKLSCIENENTIGRRDDNCLDDMAERRLQPLSEANNSGDEGKKGSSNVVLDGRKSCFNMAKCATRRDYTMSVFKGRHPKQNVLNFKSQKSLAIMYWIFLFFIKSILTILKLGLNVRMQTPTRQRV